MSRWFLVLPLVGIGCDDPVEGPIGALVLTAKPTVWDDDRGGPHRVVEDVAHVRLNMDVLEAVVDGRDVVLDSADNVFSVSQYGGEVILGQFEVPVGELEMLRFLVHSVEVETRDGSISELSPGGGDLPSWDNQGMRVEMIGSRSIVEDGFHGARVHFNFGQNMLHPPGMGFKILPEFEGELVEINPEEGEAGVYWNQVDVSIDPGLSASEIAAIHDTVGATVLKAAPGQRWSRVKLPASVNIEEGLDAYAGQSGVEAALPAVTLEAHNTGANSSNWAQVSALPAVQRTLSPQTARPGSMATVVAVIGQGIDLAHRDLYQNVWLNNAAIPQPIWNQLQAEKDATCARGPRSCSQSKLSRRQWSQMTCTDAQQRLQLQNDCLDIRNQIQNECFGGVPDGIHQAEIGNVQNGVNQCTDAVRRKCDPHSPEYNP